MKQDIGRMHDNWLNRQIEEHMKQYDNEEPEYYAYCPKCDCYNDDNNIGRELTCTDCGWDLKDRIDKFNDMDKHKRIHLDDLWRDVNFTIIQALESGDAFHWLPAAEKERAVIKESIKQTDKIIEHHFKPVKL